MESAHFVHLKYNLAKIMKVETKFKNQSSMISYLWWLECKCPPSPQVLVIKPATGSPAGGDFERRSLLEEACCWGWVLGLISRAHWGSELGHSYCSYPATDEWRCELAVRSLSWGSFPFQLWDWSKPSPPISCFWRELWQSNKKVTATLAFLFWTHTYKVHILLLQCLLKWIQKPY